ncbi:MAG TPA: hypothetical protein VGI42_07120 [Chthoniobacterales bacterium]|jgi:type II secretory pathway pseudopilin PulG
MRRNGAFTLVEIAIATLLMVMLLLLALPSLNGVLADGRLRSSLNAFNALVRQAQERSVAERRSYLIVWMKGALALQPEESMKKDDPEQVAVVRLRKDESFRLMLPAALAKDPPAQWIFWASGNCEPAEVTYRGRNGGWTAKYSALTARPEISKYVAR